MTNDTRLSDAQARGVRYARELEGHLGWLDTFSGSALCGLATASGIYTYLGVSSTLPTRVTQNPAEYKKVLEAFVDNEARSRDIEASTHMVLSHDPAVELNTAILRAIHDSGADLVVMGTHIPGIMEHIFSSHGGWIASHAPVSVMLVR